MTTRIAIFMGMMLLGAIVVDWALFDSESLRFLGKKLFDLTEWMAFWR